MDNAVNIEYQKLVNVAGKIVTPKTWAISTKGELNPIEFEFKTSADDQKPLDSKFVAELFENLEALGLVNVFGIGIRNKKIGWESTDMINRANIVQYANHPEAIDAKLINVQWAFDNFGGFIENGFCIYVEIDGHRVHKHFNFD